MSRSNTMVIICVLSGVAGLSVTTGCGWGLWLKLQTWEHIYPEGDEFARNSTSEIRKVWHSLGTNWGKWQAKDVTLISLFLAMSVLQTIVGMIFLYGSEKVRIMSTRFVLCNTGIFLAMLCCLIGILSTSNNHLTVFKVPSKLRGPMNLSPSSIMATLQLGINTLVFLALMNLFAILIFNTALLLLCKSLRKEQ